MQVLALDIGTSSVKAAVLDVAGCRPVSSIARRHYDLEQPTPETATLAPGGVWQAVIEAGREACLGQRVEGVGISCLSPALILLGEQDKPLTPIVTHLDRRSRAEARRAWEEVGREFLASTGNKSLPGGITAVTFRHLANQDAGLASHVRRYLHVNGWLLLQLTGVAAFDPANACFSGLYDTMGTKQWSPRWCAYFGIDSHWLPMVVSGDQPLAGLADDAAELLQVPAGIPVRLGTADTSCAMLAAGMKPGDLLHLVGTTQVLAVLIPRPQPDENRLTRPLGVGEAFVHVTHNPVGGVALDWIRNLCFSDLSHEDFYDRSVPAAIDRQTTVMLDPPFLGGDRLQIEPRLAALTNLGLSTDRLDLLAAVLAAMRRHHYEAVAALGQGSTFRRVFLSGGGAEVVRRLIPEYGRPGRPGRPVAGDAVELLEEASLRGVARLFGD